MLEFGPLFSYPILLSLCIAFNLCVLDEAKFEDPWNNCDLPELHHLHLFSTHSSVYNLKVKIHSCTEMCAVGSWYLPVPVKAFSIDRMSAEAFLNTMQILQATTEKTVFVQWRDRTIWRSTLCCVIFIWFSFENIISAGNSVSATEWRPVSSSSFCLNVPLWIADG